MIRGTTAQFRFRMPYEFSELCIIEVALWQPGNSGTIERPLPIIRVYNKQFITTDVWPLDVVDDTKVYKYTGDNRYYKKEDDEWISSETMDEFIRNDGIAQDADDPKIVWVTLTPEETLRFSDQRKGYVQIRAYCETKGVLMGNKPERFMVYPVINEDIFVDIGQGIKPGDVHILDAGELK